MNNDRMKSVSEHICKMKTDLIESIHKSVVKLYRLTEVTDVIVWFSVTRANSMSTKIKVTVDTLLSVSVIQSRKA